MANTPAPNEVQLHKESTQQLILGVQTEISAVGNPYQTQRRQATLNQLDASFGAAVADYNNLIRHRHSTSQLRSVFVELQPEVETLREIHCRKPSL
ncbi:hypothetical protein FRC03_003789 [Tulasnella sp. 419]|nr:hypothetical protein FRC03_003789 [Tulasnella sp. 419]